MIRLKIKALAIMVSLLLVSSVSTGCGGKKATDSTSNNTTVTEVNTLPIVKTPITLKIFAVNYQTALVKSYGDIEGFKAISEKTGINLEWIHPAGTGTEQFNVMIASGDYPDIIFWNYDTSISKYIDDKVGIKLNDYLDKYAPNFNKILEQNPTIKKQITLDDGTIPKFPQIDLNEKRLNYRGFQMRQDWLDKVNMKAPVTMDDWYKVLKAFKEADLNGNGKSDEIPYAFEGVAPNGNTISGLEPFAGAWGLRTTFYKNPKTGKITYGYLEPGMKDFLTTMNKWYTEGLIDPEYITVDRKTIDKKVLNNTVGSYWGTATYMNGYHQLMNSKDPKFSITAIQFPTGVAGKAYHTVDQAIRLVSGFGGMVTSTSKHPVEAVRFCDYLYSEAGLNYQNWGIEGKSYTVENGKKKLTDEILKNPDGKLPGQAMIKYANNSNGFMKVMDYDLTQALDVNLPDYVKKPADEAKVAWSKADMSLLMPTLNLTGEENAKYTTIMSEVNTLVNEKISKFIMGVEPISNYDDFVKGLKKMGIEDALKIQQAAYDRYANKK